MYLENFLNSLSETNRYRKGLQSIQVGFLLKQVGFLTRFLSLWKSQKFLNAVSEVSKLKSPMQGYFSWREEFLPKFCWNSSNELIYCFCENCMNMSVATLSHVSLFQLLSIQYQKIHIKYSVIWKEYHLEHRRVFLHHYFFYLVWKTWKTLKDLKRCWKTLNGKLTCWKWHINFEFRNHKDINVS